MKNRPALLRILFVLGLSFPVLAVEYSAVLSSGVEYSDNIRLVTDQKEQDVRHTLSLSGRVVEERKTFQTSASFMLEKDHYYGSAYEGETTLSTGLGLLNFDVIEELLSWQTSFTRSQTLNDPLEQALPGNLGYRDVLSSGPSITYVLTPTTYLTGEGNYRIVENSQGNIADTQRADLSAVVAHQINSTTAMNLTGQYEVMLESDGADKYDRFQFGVRFTRRFVDGNISLSAGQTKLEPKGKLSTESSYYNLRFNHQNLLLHDVTISYMSDVSDSSIGFESEFSDIELNLPTTFAVEGNDIVERRLAVVSLERNLGSYRYIINLSQDHEDYELQNRDQIVKYAGFTLDKDVYSNFNIGISLEFEQTNYVNQSGLGKENVRTYRIDGHYQIVRDVTSSVFIQHENRQSFRSSSREYEEVSVGVELSWTLL